MPSTVEDFWRMVTEHNICTMVQLNAPTQTATDRGYFYWAESDAPGSQITYGMKLELQKNLECLSDLECTHPENWLF